MATLHQAAKREETTVEAALQKARAALVASGTADLDAQVLLAHVLGCERAFLFAHPEASLDFQTSMQFQSLLQRRASGEPMAYILGAQGFYDLELKVTPSVLVPRPETELLLEEALQLTADSPDATVADIGTGSGALAVTFARHRPQCTVYATDISADALEVARDNAREHCARVSFFRGHLAQPLTERGIKVELLMANLPYIASDELDTLPVSQWEPRQALDGGPDGLAYIRTLLQQAPRVCRAGAYVLLEIGADQGAAVSRLILDLLGADCCVLKDYAGLDRIARFQL
ncbi:MAG: peptide chain release factor N(5)-glutamine methyltransferase [Anaerolineae bacterium]|nr:peptide chain release factor N(5)-glutamine methyltransferase [Anaerolineae bacterium]